MEITQNETGGAVSGCGSIDQNLWNPVTLSACEPASGIFTIKIRRRTRKLKVSNVLERMSIDDSISLAINLAQHKWANAAYGTHIEIRGFRAKTVFRHKGIVTKLYCKL